MILLQSHSRFLLQTLLNRVQNLEKAVELDHSWVEFDDVRYHVQVSAKNPHHLLLSVSLPTPPPETTFFGGLPSGAIEAIKAAYGVLVHILDPPRDGFNLTLKLNLSKLPPDEGSTSSLFKEFVEARRTAGLGSAPPCSWSPSPPVELKGAPADALSANVGFVSFVIFSRHVEGKKLECMVWSLSTFHAYVSYHVKCSEGFMHTRMRRRVESLIQALGLGKPDTEKPDTENSKKSANNRSFKRLSLKDAQRNSNS